MEDKRSREAGEGRRVGFVVVEVAVVSSEMEAVRSETVEVRVDLRVEHCLQDL